MKGKKKFKFIEHTADIKFKVFGKSLSEIFENSALAMSDIFSRGGKIKSEKSRKVIMGGDDNEAILYEFIDELIYLMDAEGFVVSKAKVKILDGKLTGIVYGDDAKNYKDLDQVKNR